MTATPENTIAKLLEIYHGGSTRASLAETGTGGRFVLKLSGAGPGRHGLLTEFLASRIAYAAGAPVPYVCPLFLPDTMPWQVGTDEFDEMLQRSHGWNLGVQFVAEAQAVSAADVDALPEVLRDLIASLDAMLQNVDRAANNLNMLRDGQGRVWLIDFGACLFLDRVVAARRPFDFSLPKNHVLVARRNKMLWLTGVDDEAVWAAVADAPEQWFEHIPFGRAELLLRLQGYIADFRRSAMIVNPPS